MDWLLYENAMVQNPYLIIRDRLTETVILWDVHNNAYNDIYSTELEIFNPDVSAKVSKLKRA